MTCWGEIDRMLTKYTYLEGVRVWAKLPSLSHPHLIPASTIDMRTVGADSSGMSEVDE